MNNHGKETSITVTLNAVDGRYAQIHCLLFSYIVIKVATSHKCRP